MAYACTSSFRALTSSQLPTSLLTNPNSLMIPCKPTTARRSFPIVTHPSCIIRASMGSNTAAGNSKPKIVMIGSAITVILAVANRVLYKLALVPMKQYPFFLAQLTTFGYMLIYFSILYARYRAGIVTEEMIALPKWRYTAIGMLEAIGVASGMAAAAMLPGPAIPILTQSFLVWQLAFSALLLGRRYSFNQIAGCLLVAAGVIVAVASGSDTDRLISGTNFVWPMVMIASAAFQAGASIIKEFIFVDAVKRLKGKSLDIFVVNSFGSGFQALFVLLLLPLLSNLRGIPLVQLPSYLKSGAGCFLKIGANTSGKLTFTDACPIICMPILSYVSTYGVFTEIPNNQLKLSTLYSNHLVLIAHDIELLEFLITDEKIDQGACDGAPLLPLLYVVTNMAFNISALNLMKVSSAVVASLAVTLSVPVAIYILSLPLPYLPEGSSLSPFFLFGSGVLVLGLVLYNVSNSKRAKEESKAA